MRIGCLLFLFISIVFQGYSQKGYETFRDSLEGLSCVDSNEVYNAKVNISLLNEYISENPAHYDAYYDLGMEYQAMAIHDTLGRQSIFW